MVTLTHVDCNAFGVLVLDDKAGKTES